jgi:hypothetical protein
MVKEKKKKQLDGTTVDVTSFNDERLLPPPPPQTEFSPKLETNQSNVGATNQQSFNQNLQIDPNLIQEQKMQTEQRNETNMQNASRGNDQLFTQNDRPSGVTVNGRTFLGLSPDEVEQLLAQEEAKKGGPATRAFAENVTLQNQQIEAQAQQERIQQVIQQLGLSSSQVQAIQSGLVEAPIEWQQALTAGGVSIIPSAIKGAGAGLVAGAIGGTALTPGIGTAIGAGAGLLAGLTSGILSNIKQQQKGEINKEVDVLTNAKTNMARLSTLASKDPGNAPMYVEIYNQQLAQVYRAQSKIKLETQGNLNSFMEDGTEILSNFELFLQPGGQADLYRRQLEMSLVGGTPPPLSLEDFE